jgi:hypothetical protein
MDERKIKELIAKNLYDAKTTQTLEEYVDYQVTNNTHDFDANRHLLRLYSTAPESSNADVIVKILLKTLMCLPESYFVAAKYLIPRSISQNEESVQKVYQLGKLLDSADFPKFWASLKSDFSTLTASFVGFDDAIREFASTLVENTYQSLSSETLQEYLNISDQKQFQVFCEQRSWTITGSSVSLGGVCAASAEHENEHDVVPLDQISKVLSIFG